eukprot:TRINITY_DN8785_c0_g1_i1.p1 TRINITY_DN8785_c0_g1~~TRINITY_DN8785_c0_g1_i1.p1  ORF type:complete len:227 (-),score=30.17 TRINITY_DN8785_c0_g1_i1:1-681(-)
MNNTKEDLLKLLTNRRTRLRLREYLGHRFCDEYIDFWERAMTISMFLEHHVEQKQQVTDLVEEFVDVSGERSLNFSWSDRDRLIHAVEAYDCEEAKEALMVCIERVEEMIQLNFLSGFLEKLRVKKKKKKTSVVNIDKRECMMSFAQVHVRKYSNPPLPTRDYADVYLDLSIKKSKSLKKFRELANKKRSFNMPKAPSAKRKEKVSLKKRKNTLKLIRKKTKQGSL